MPYELVTPEGEEKVSPDVTFSKGWVGNADAGYSDSFRALKAKMGFVRQQYKDQMDSIPVRKKALRKELKKCWFDVLLYLLIIPIGLTLLTDLLMNLGVDNGFFAIVYLIMKILYFPACFVSLFIALPPTIRTLINCQRRYNAFMNPAEHAGYRDKYDIVSFGEEEHFLRQQLLKHEEFDHRVRTEHLDEVGGGEEVISLDEMTEKQKATLWEMEEMAVFKDYQARIGVNRAEGDIKWIILGLGVGVVVTIGGFAFVMWS